MTKVIGVRFRTAGKIYFFDPLEFQIEKGGHVIVETARGIEFGTVVSVPQEVEDEKVIQPLKPVLRIANDKDIEQEAANKLKEREAFKVCLEKIRKHELEMKLIDAEYTFDNNKVLFYFTADGRIDFRELVKDLASVFKTRIELRQIGVRDETKIVGGIGICGRPLCCNTHLSEFIPVSIKMAKEQNLSLNPTKISGVCGRLMCCLKHEEETYEELNRRLPGVGDRVTSVDGLSGEVQSVNVLRQLVKVIVEVGDEKEIHEYKVEDLRFRRKHSRRERLELSEEELKELEKLEAEDRTEGVEEESKGQEEPRYKKNYRDKKEDQNEGTNFSERKGNRRNNRNGRRENYQENGSQRQRESYQENGSQRQKESYQENGSQRQRENYQENGSQRRNDNHSGEGKNRAGNRPPRNRRNNRNGKKEGSTNFESN